MTAPLPPLDDLDVIFVLPESVGDEDLRTMYEIVVNRLRRDLVAHLASPPNTLQLLVCERVSYNYVLIKQKERMRVGDLAGGGFRHMTEVKEYNAFWLTLAETLSRMMKAGNQEYRDNLLRSVARVISEVLSEVVTDPVALAAARSRVSAELANAGL